MLVIGLNLSETQSRHGFINFEVFAVKVFFKELLLFKMATMLPLRTIGAFLERDG